MVDRIAFAELHCHTNFSFLDGASAPDELVERAVALGLSGLAVTDHQGLYGVVRFATAAAEAGLHPVIGVEIELVDRGGPGPGRPGRAGPPAAAGAGHGARPALFGALDGRPAERRCIGRPGRGSAGPSPPDADPPAGPSRRRSRRTCAASGPGVRGPHLVLLARDAHGLPEPLPARLAGEHGRHEGRAAVHPGAPRRARRGPDRAVGLSRRGDRPAAPGRRPGGCAGGRRSATRQLFGGRWRVAGESAARARSRRRASSSSSSTTSRRTTTGSSRRRRAWPRSWACRSS